MRLFLVLLPIIALTRPLFAQVSAQNVPLAQETGVEIELQQDISSETIKAGQVVPFKVRRLVELNGSDPLPAGTAVTAIVEKVQSSGHWGKSGAFNLVLQPLKLGDGTVVHIDFPRPQYKNEKMEKAGRRTGAAIYYSYYFPFIPIALIADARKGKPFTIRSGERYLVYVTSTDAPPTAPVAEPSKP